MFNLERELAIWCDEVIGTGCVQAGDRSELQDHVMCLVDELRLQHPSLEEAFAAALQQMGSTAQLRQAYLRSEPWHHRVLAWDQAQTRKLTRKLTDRYTGRQLSWLLVAFSIVCAVAMLVVAAIAPQASSAINGWLVAIWMVPFLLVASLPQVRRAECAALRRLRWW